MTEQSISDGLLYVFAVFGGLWMLFMLVAGLCYLWVMVADFLKRVRLVRRIAGRVG